MPIKCPSLPVTIHQYHHDDQEKYKQQIKTQQNKLNKQQNTQNQQNKRDKHSAKTTNTNTLGMNRTGLDKTKYR